MNKKLTIKEYLKEEKNKKLNILLEGYYLKDIPIELFFENFEEVGKTPEKVAQFILSSAMNNELSYTLAAFGVRQSELLMKKFEDEPSNFTGINDNIDDEDYYYSNYFR